MTTSGWGRVEHACNCSCAICCTETVSDWNVVWLMVYFTIRPVADIEFNSYCFEKHSIFLLPSISFSVNIPMRCARIIYSPEKSECVSMSVRAHFHRFHSFLRILVVLGVRVRVCTSTTLHAILAISAQSQLTTVLLVAVVFPLLVFMFIIFLACFAIEDKHKILHRANVAVFSAQNQRKNGKSEHCLKWRYVFDV